MATGRILPSPSASAYCCARMTASSTARVRTCLCSSVRRFDVRAHSTRSTRNPSVLDDVLADPARQRGEVAELHLDADARVMDERQLDTVLVPRPCRPGPQLLRRPPRHGTVVTGPQRRHRRLDGFEVACHPVVDRFHRRALEGDGGVHGRAFRRLERCEGSSHGDLRLTCGHRSVGGRPVGRRTAGRVVNIGGDRQDGGHEQRRRRVRSGLPTAAGVSRRPAIPRRVIAGYPQPGYQGYPPPGYHGYPPPPGYPATRHRAIRRRVIPRLATSPRRSHSSRASSRCGR